MFGFVLYYIWMRKLTAIDLFAGIGGVKLGLTQAGFDVIFSNDCDKYCELTFRTNFPEAYLDTRKIEEISTEEIPDHDLLAGGFPCQPFSMINSIGFIKKQRAISIF